MKITNIQTMKKILAGLLCVSIALQGNPLPISANNRESASLATKDTEKSLLDTVRTKARNNFKEGENPTATSVDLDMSAHTFDGTAEHVVDYGYPNAGVEFSPHVNVLENLKKNDLGGSIIFRFKTDSAGIVFGSGSSNINDGTNMVFMVKPNGRLRFYLRNSKSNGLSGEDITAGGPNLKDNKWHTVAFTFRSGEAENAYITVDGGPNLYPSSWYSSWNPGFNKEIAGVSNTYKNFQVGGGVYNSAPFGNVGNFNGDIDFITVSDQKFTLAQMQELTSNRNNFGVMQQAGTANTWVITGADTTVAKFDEIGPVKNYVGFFEDKLRESGTYVERSRFVFNTAQAGLTIADINKGYENYIAKYGSKAVGVMVDHSDYQKGEEGVSTFKMNLKELVSKIYGDKKIPFLITPIPSKDAADTSLITAYITAMKEVAAENDTTMIDVSTLDTSYLNEQNVLTVLGHQKVANTIKTSLGVGTITAYTGFTLPVNPTSIKVDAAPSVKVTNTEVQVEVPEGYQDANWEYSLFYDGQQSSEKERHAPFRITGLEQEKEYVLRMTSNDGHVQKQLKDVKFKVINGEIPSVLEHEDASINPAVDLSDLMNKEESVTYLFMGDSITHGVVSNGYDNVPQLFEKYLREQGRPKDVVINSAVSNATMDTTLNQIDRRLNQFQPDVVMVMLGTNDSSTNGQRVDGGSGFTVDEFKSKYKELVRDIYAKNENAYIVLRVPCEMIVDGPHSNYKAFFHAIYEVESEMKTELTGLKISVVDHMKNWIEYGENVRSDFLNNGVDGWLVDNVHPNARGNMAMFQQILKETGLYKYDSMISNYAYKFSEWASDSAIHGEVVYQKSNRNVSLAMSSLATYGNGLNDVTLTLFDDKGLSYTKSATYVNNESIEIKVGSDYIPTSVVLTGTDRTNHKKVAFKSTLTTENECTCRISELIFTGQHIQMLYTDSATQVTLRASATVTGNCTLPGHAEHAIEYVYTIGDDEHKIGSITGNALTVTGPGNISVNVTASVNNCSTTTTANFEVEKEVNKALLQTTIVVAEGRMEKVYTVSSWADMQDDLMSAKSIRDNQKATQEQVEKANASLQAAIAALKLRGDTTALAENVTTIRGENLNEKDYIPTSWKEFEKALFAADKLIADHSDATQVDVDTALIALLTAKAALIKNAEDDTTLAKSILQSAIEKATAAEASDEFVTLAPSVQALIISMRNAAQGVYDNTEATNVQCMEAWINLANALQFLDFQANKEALLSLIKTCNEINTDDYTGGVEVFKAALVHAQSVYDNPNALQASINEAYDNLDAARIKLVKEANKALLEFMISSIEKQIDDGSRYKQDENWKAFMKALADAKVVLANVVATQAEVNTALTTLSNAYVTIRLLPSEEQLAELNGFIAAVKGIYRRNFTSEQLAVIDETAGKVEAMINDFDETQFVSTQKAMHAALNIINEVTIEKPSVPGNTGGEGSVKAAEPNTGDYTNTAVMLTLLLVSGCVAMLVRRKRNQNI